MCDGDLKKTNQQKTLFRSALSFNYIHRAHVGILTSAVATRRITTMDHSPHHQSDLLMSGAGPILTPLVSLPLVNALGILPPLRIFATC